MKVLLLSGLFYLMAGMPGNPDCDRIQLSITITNTSEDRDNGKLSVVVEKGAAPFKFHLFAFGRNENRLDIKEKDLKNLAAGEYLLVVQDNNNCKLTENVVVK